MSTSEFGLPPSTLQTIRNILAEFPAVKKAVIFGSRAKGNYRPGSDIDLTLAGDEVNLDTLGKIAARLHESPIPFQVDLSAYKLIEHAGLRQHIDRVGITLYEA